MVHTVRGSIEPHFKHTGGVPNDSASERRRRRAAAAVAEAAAAAAVAAVEPLPAMPLTALTVVLGGTAAVAAAPKSIRCGPGALPAPYGVG